MGREADRRVERVLAHQHGVISRTQALGAGLSSSMVRSRLSSGTWRRVDRGVYVHTAHRATWEQRCMAAVLGHPHAVLGGKAAAVVHGLMGFRAGPVEITVPHRSGRATTLAVVRRSDLVERTFVRGFPVNAVPVTLVELAGRVSFRQLDRAFEDAVLRKLTTFDRVAELCTSLVGSHRRGLGDLRGILESRDSGFVPAESELEALLIAALDAPGIPPISRQAPFPWSPDDSRRVDGFIEPWGLLLEADGRRWHGRLATMEDDRRRDQEAVRRGYQPLRFGWAELRDDPDRVRAIVMDAGRRRSPGRIACRP